jgi:hypothetical protein
MNDPLLDPSTWLSSKTWRDADASKRKEIVSIALESAKEVLEGSDQRIQAPVDTSETPETSPNKNWRKHTDFSSRVREGQLSKAGEHYLSQFSQVLEAASSHPTGGLRKRRSLNDKPVALFGKQHIAPFNPKDFDPIVRSYENFKEVAEREHAELKAANEEAYRKSVEEYALKANESTGRVEGIEAPKPLPEPPPPDLSFEAWVAKHNSSSPDNAQLDPENPELRKRIEGTKDMERKHEEVRKRGVMVEMDGDTPIFNTDMVSRVKDMEEAIDKIPADEATKTLVRMRYESAAEGSASALIGYLANSESILQRSPAEAPDKSVVLATTKGSVNKGVNELYQEYAADPNSGSDLDFLRKHPELVNYSGYAVAKKKMAAVFESLFMANANTSAALLDAVGLDEMAEGQAEAAAFSSEKLGNLTGIYGSQKIIGGVTSDALYMAAGQLIEMYATGKLAGLGRTQIGKSMVTNAAGKNVAPSINATKMSKGVPAFLSKEAGIGQTLESLSTMGIYGGAQAFGLEVSSKYNDEIAAGKTPDEARARAYAAGAWKAGVVAITTGLIGALNPGAESLLAMGSGRGVGGLFMEGLNSLRGRTALREAMAKVTTDKAGLGRLAKDVASAIQGHSASLGFQMWKPAQKFLYASGAEGVEEFIQDSLGEALDIVVNDDKSWSEAGNNFVEKLPQYLDALIVGAMMGGTTSFRGQKTVVDGKVVYPEYEKMKLVADRIGQTSLDQELVLGGTVTTLKDVMAVDTSNRSEVSKAVKQIVALGEGVVAQQFVEPSPAGSSGDAGNAGVPGVASAPAAPATPATPAGSAPPVDANAAASAASPKVFRPKEATAGKAGQTGLPLAVSEAAVKPADLAGWVWNKFFGDKPLPAGMRANQKATIMMGEALKGSSLRRSFHVIHPVNVNGTVRGYIVGEKGPVKNTLATHEWVPVENMQARLDQKDQSGQPTLRIAEGTRKNLVKALANVSLASSIQGNDPLLTPIYDEPASSPNAQNGAAKPPALPAAAGNSQEPGSPDGGGSAPNAGEAEQGAGQGPRRDSSGKLSALSVMAGMLEQAEKLPSNKRKKAANQIKSLFKVGSRSREILDVLFARGVVVKFADNEGPYKAKAQEMDDDSIVITLFEKALDNDKLAFTTLLHEAIHAADYLYKRTPEGKKARAEIEEMMRKGSLDKGDPDYDAEDAAFVAFVKKDYPRWDKQSDSTKLAEAIRTSTEVLITGRTTYNIPGMMNAYLKGLLDFTKNLFKTKPEAASYFQGLINLLEGKTDDSGTSQPEAQKKEDEQKTGSARNESAKALLSKPPASWTSDDILEGWRLARYFRERGKIGEARKIERAVEDAATQGGIVIKDREGEIWDEGLPEDVVVAEKNPDEKRWVIKTLSPTLIRTLPNGSTKILKLGSIELVLKEEDASAPVAKEPSFAEKLAAAIKANNAPPAVGRDVSPVDEATPSETKDAPASGETLFAADESGDAVVKLGDEDLSALSEIANAKSLEEVVSSLASMVETRKSDLPDDLDLPDDFEAQLEAFIETNVYGDESLKEAFDLAAGVVQAIRQDATMMELGGDGLKALMAKPLTRLSVRSFDLSGKDKDGPADEDTERLRRRMEAASLYSSVTTYVSESEVVEVDDNTVRIVQPAGASVAPPGIGNIVMIKRDNGDLAVDEVLRITQRTERADGSVVWTFTRERIELQSDGAGGFTFGLKSKELRETLFGRSRLNAAAQEYEEFLLGNQSGFTKEKLEKFINRLLNDMSSGKRSERIRYERSPLTKAFRTEATNVVDGGVSKNLQVPKVKLQPEIIINPEALLNQLNELIGYNRNDLKGMGRFERKALALQATRMIARQLDEEIIHAVVLRTFRTPKLLKFYIQAENSKLFSGKDGLIERIANAQGMDRNTTKGRVGIAVEIMSYLHQLGHSGSTFSKETEALRELARHIRSTLRESGPRKDKEARRKSGALRTIIQMVRHYSERVATVLRARSFEGMLTPFQQRLLSSLTEAVSQANQVTDFDDVIGGAEKITKFNRKGSLEVLKDKVKQAFISDNEGAMALRDLARNLQQPLRRLMAFNWDEGVVGLRPELEDFLKEGGQDEALASIKNYFDLLNNSRTIVSLQRATSDAAQALDAATRRLGQVSPVSVVGRAIRRGKSLESYAKGLNLLYRKDSLLNPEALKLASLKDISPRVGRNQLLQRIVRGEIAKRQEEYDTATEWLNYREASNRDAPRGVRTGESKGKLSSRSTEKRLRDHQARAREALEESQAFLTELEADYKVFSGRDPSLAQVELSANEKILDSYLEALADYNDLIRNFPSRLLGVEPLDSSDFGTRFTPTGNPNGRTEQTMFGYDYENPNELVVGSEMGYGVILSTPRSALDEARRKEWDERMRAKRGNAVNLARTEHARARFLKDTGLFPDGVNSDHYFISLGFSTPLREVRGEFPGDVSYEPSDPTPLLKKFDLNRPEWRPLREGSRELHQKRFEKMLGSFLEAKEWAESIRSLMDPSTGSPFVAEIGGKATPAGMFRDLWENRMSDFLGSFSILNGEAGALSRFANGTESLRDTEARFNRVVEVIKAMSSEVKLMRDLSREFHSSTLSRSIKDDVRRIQVEAKSPLGLPSDIAGAYRDLAFSVPTLNALEWTQTYLKERGTYRLSPVFASELMTLWAAVQTSKKGKELFVEQINEEREMSADITGSAEQTIFTAEEKAFGQDRERRGTSGETGQGILSDARVTTRRGLEGYSRDMDFEARTDRDWASMAAFSLMGGNANQARRLFRLFEEVNNPKFNGFYDERSRSEVVPERELNDILRDVLLDVAQRFPKANIMDLAMPHAPMTIINDEVVLDPVEGFGYSLANHFGSAQNFMVSIMEKLSNYEQGVILEARKDAGILGARILEGLPAAPELSNSDFLAEIDPRTQGIGEPENVQARRRAGMGGDIRAALEMDLRSASGNQNSGLSIHRASDFEPGMIDVLRDARVASLLLQSAPEVVVYVPSKAAASRHGLNRVELVRSGDALLLVAPDDVSQRPSAMREVLTGLLFSKWDEVGDTVNRTAQTIREVFTHYQENSAKGFDQFARKLASKDLPPSVVSALTEKGIEALLARHIHQMENLEAMILNGEVMGAEQRTLLPILLSGEGKKRNDLRKTGFRSDNEAIRSTAFNVIYDPNPTEADNLALVVEAFTNPEFADLLSKAGVPVTPDASDQWAIAAVRSDSSNRAVMGERFDINVEDSPVLDQASLEDLARSMTALFGRESKDTSEKAQELLIKQINKLSEQQLGSLMGFIHTLVYAENGAQLGLDEINELKSAWLSGSRDATDFLGVVAHQMSKALKQGVTPEGMSVFDLGNDQVRSLRGGSILAGQTPLYKFPSGDQSRVVASGIGDFRNGANPLTPVWANRRTGALSSVMYKRLPIIRAAVEGAREQIERSRGSGAVVDIENWSDPLGELQQLFPIVDIETVAEGIREERKALLAHIERVNKDLAAHRKRRSEIAFSAKDQIGAAFDRRNEVLDDLLSNYIENTAERLADAVVDGRGEVDARYVGLSHWLKTRATPQLEPWKKLRSVVSAARSTQAQIDWLESQGEDTWSSDDREALVEYTKSLEVLLKTDIPSAVYSLQRELNYELGYYMAVKEGQRVKGEERLFSGHGKAYKKIGVSPEGDDVVVSRIRDGGVVSMSGTDISKWSGNLEFYTPKQLKNLTISNVESMLGRITEAISPVQLAQRLEGLDAWRQAAKETRTFGETVMGKAKKSLANNAATRAEIRQAIQDQLDALRKKEQVSLEALIENEFVPGPEERQAIINYKRGELLGRTDENGEKVEGSLDARIRNLITEKERALAALNAKSRTSSFVLDIQVPLTPEEVEIRSIRGLGSDDTFSVIAELKAPYKQVKLDRRIEDGNPFTDNDETLSKAKEEALMKVAEENFEHYLVMQTMRKAAKLYAEERGEAVYSQVKGDSAFFEKNFDMDAVVQETMRRVGLEDALINARMKDFTEQWDSTDNKFGLSGTELAWLGKIGDLVVMKDGELMKVVKSKGKYEADARTFGMMVKNSDGNTIMLLPHDAKQRFVEFESRMGRQYANRGDVDEAFRGLVLNAALPLGSPSSPTPSAGHAIFHNAESFGAAFLDDQASPEIVALTGLSGTRRELGEILAQKIRDSVPNLVAKGGLKAKQAETLMASFVNEAKQLVAMHDQLLLDKDIFDQVDNNGVRASILNTIEKLSKLNSLSTKNDFVELNLTASYAKAFANTIGRGMLERIATGVVKVSPNFQKVVSAVYHERAQISRKYGKNYAALQEMQRVIGLLHYGFDGATGRAAAKSHYEEARAKIAEAAKPFGDSWEAQSKAYVIASLKGIEVSGGSKLGKTGDWIRDFESGVQDLLNLKNNTLLSVGKFDQAMNDPNTKVMNEFDGTAAIYRKIQSAIADFKVGSKTDADAQAFIDEAVKALSEGETPKGRQTRENYVRVLHDVFGEVQEAMRVSQLLGTNHDEGGAGALNNLLSEPVSLVPLRFGYAADPMMLQPANDKHWNNPAKHVAVEDSSMFVRNVAKKKGNTGFRPLDINGLVAPDRLIADAYYRINLSHNYEVFRRIFGRMTYTKDGEAVPTPGAMTEVFAGLLDDQSRIIWKGISKDIVNSYEETILRDKASGAEATNLQAGINYFNSLYTASILVSPSQITKQTIPPVTGFIAKKLLTGQHKTIPWFFKAMKIAAAEAANGGKGPLTSFVKDVNIYLYNRGFDGSDQFRPQERGQKLYGRKGFKQLGKKTANAVQQVGEGGLDLVMARGERFLIRAIYVTELFSQLQEMKALYGSAAPDSIEELITWSPDRIDTLAKVMADGLTTDMMGLGDKSKKAEIFHWGSKSPIINSFLTGLSRFSNHLLTTSASAAGLASNLFGAEDSRMRRMAWENVIGTVVQNGMFPMMKWRYFIPMMTTFFALLNPEDEDEDAEVVARRAQAYADALMKRDPEATGLSGWAENAAKATFFGNGANAFDRYMDDEKRWNSDPLQSFKNGMATMATEVAWEGMNIIPIVGPTLSASFISENIISTKSGFQSLASSVVNGMFVDEDDEIGFRLGISKGDRNLSFVRGAASATRPTAFIYDKAESLFYLAQNLQAEDEEARPTAMEAIWQTTNALLPLFREWEASSRKDTEEKGVAGPFK